MTTYQLEVKYEFQFALTGYDETFTGGGTLEETLRRVAHESADFGIAAAPTGAIGSGAWPVVRTAASQYRQVWPDSDPNVCDMTEAPAAMSSTLAVRSPTKADLAGIRTTIERPVTSSGASSRRVSDGGYTGASTFNAVITLTLKRVKG